jgi:hypothetical protein
LISIGTMPATAAKTGTVIAVMSLVRTMIAPYSPGTHTLIAMGSIKPSFQM